MTTALHRPLVFLATADPAVAPGGRLPAARINLEAGVLGALGFQAITGAPFVWQSGASPDALSALSVAVGSQALAISTPPGIVSATAYLTKRMHDTAPLGSLHERDGASLFLSEVPTRDAFVIADGLDRLAHGVPRTSSVESLFVRSFSDDLLAWHVRGSVRNRVHDELPTKYADLARRRAERLLIDFGSLGFGPHFSRAAVEHTAKEALVSPQLVGGVNERSTALFHVANALAAGAVLFTDERFACDIPHGVEYAHPNSFSVYNPYLFLRVLRRLGVPVETLRTLRADQWIHEVGAAVEFLAFVEEYKRLVAKCGMHPERHSRGFTLYEYLLADVDALRGAGSRARVAMRILENESVEWFLGTLASVSAGMADVGVAGSLAAGWKVRGIAKAGREWLRRRLAHGAVVVTKFERWLDDSGYRPGAPPAVRATRRDESDLFSFR